MAKRVHVNAKAAGQNPSENANAISFFGTNRVPRGILCIAIMHKVAKKRPYNRESKLMFMHSLFRFQNSAVKL